MAIGIVDAVLRVVVRLQLHALSVVMAGLLCAGCQLVQVAAPADDPARMQRIQQREAHLARLVNWRAQGALRIDSDTQGEQNVLFAWDNNQNGIDLRLFGPLGRQAFRIWENDLVAQMQQENQPVIYADSADQLLEAALGLLVPVQQMRRWAIGLADQGERAVRDSKGRLRDVTIRKSGSSDWRVQYPRYRSVRGLTIAAGLQQSNTAPVIAGAGAASDSSDSAEAAATVTLDLPVELEISSDGVAITISIRKWTQPETAPSDGRLTIPGLEPGA